MIRKVRNRHQRIWELFNNKNIPSGYHIHHIDGNRKNNNPENLLCVSPQEHYDIHLKQYKETGSSKDFAACNFLSKEINGHKKLQSPRLGVKMSEESRKKMSKAKKGMPAWNKGVPCSIETKIKLSISHKGKKWTDEMKRNFIKVRAGQIMNNAKPFLFYGNRYRNIEEFKVDTGKSSTFLRDRLLDKSNKNVIYEKRKKRA